MCAPRAHGLGSGVTCPDPEQEAGPREDSAQEPGTNSPLGPGVWRVPPRQRTAHHWSPGPVVPLPLRMAVFGKGAAALTHNWRQTSSNCCLWWGLIN